MYVCVCVCLYTPVMKYASNTYKYVHVQICKHTHTYTPVMKYVSSVKKKKWYVRPQTHPHCTNINITNKYYGKCCSVLQCSAVHCSVLQCVAVRCSALQCVEHHNRTSRYSQFQIGRHKIVKLLPKRCQRTRILPIGFTMSTTYNNMAPMICPRESWYSWY